LLIALLQLAAGFILLVWAADRLVAGASAFARNMGISPLIVGLTIVGFGTSAPEMVVSATASLQGNPSLAIGNAIGSNIHNVALILGLTAIIYPLRIESATLRREFPVLGLVMLVALALMWNLDLSRIDGAILAGCLMLVTAGMVVLGLKKGRRDPMARSLAAEIPEGMPNRHALAWMAVGLALLPLSSHILVTGAVSIAGLLGVSEAVIGLTIVAMGTSLPELAAALVSAIKREDDLAIGNIIGSNMFNLLGVLGIAALVHPMTIEPMLLWRDVSVMFLTTGLLFIFALYRGNITRLTGGILFGVFACYMGLVIYQELIGRSGISGA